MIVVKNAEIFDTKSYEDRWRYWHKISAENQFPFPPTPAMVDDEEVFCEMVEGRRFAWHTDGVKHEVCIGWAEEVQQALGLPFEVFQNQEGMLIHQRALIAYYEDMTFWQRLKFLFKGRK